MTSSHISPEKRRLHIAEQSDYDWKKRFDLIVRQYEINYDHKSRTDFKGLYITLDNLAKHMIANGEMPEYTSYIVPFESGFRFQFLFTGKWTVLKAINASGEEKILVNEEASITKEYDILDAFSFGHSNVGGIGNRYPEELAKWLMEDVKPGQIISFDNRSVAYVCIAKHDLNIELKQVFLGDDIKYATVDNFLNSTVLKVNRNGDGLTEFYNTIKSKTLNVFPHIDTIDTYAQEKINALYSTAKTKRVATISVGNEIIRLKKSAFGNKYTWFSKNGTLVSEDAVKAYIAYVHNPPVMLRIDHKQLKGSSDIERFGDELNIRSEYEKQLICGNYAAAASTLHYAAEEFSKEFAIHIDSFDNLGAVTFAFRFDDQGKSHIMRMDYAPGDTHELVKITEANEETLAIFLKTRYEQCKILIADRQKAMLDPDCAQRPGNVDNAEQEAEECLRNLKKRDAVLQEIAPDIQTIVDSYILYPDDKTTSLSSLDKCINDAKVKHEHDISKARTASNGDHSQSYDDR